MSELTYDATTPGGRSAALARCVSLHNHGAGLTGPCVACLTYYGQDAIAAARPNPIIRYAQMPDGPEFDEFVAHNATVHFEAKGDCSWWMQVDVGGRSWHINVGSLSGRAKGYARCDEVT